ncbi:unnamed protein product [Vitrella brassicaformis CCMP3155]|uniref:Uncharacterized protein n=2 Tax=Vitrella brassicaformis TaxID=1169539 RepID=A0A0G4GRB6_VITBC|nr:unnamed protein product [Vitrella brassicaformis CCMP3155]|eukprot:CEM33051.1 unnamed protein product [Vitrella brassicaformis CCMP3155]
MPRETHGGCLNRHNWYVRRAVIILKSPVVAFFVSYRFWIIALVVLRLFYEWLKRREEARQWRDRSMMNTLQAAIYSTENLQDLRRVEKRTLFERDLREVFRNEIEVQAILTAARQAARSTADDTDGQFSASHDWDLGAFLLMGSGAASLQDPWDDIWRLLPGGGQHAARGEGPVDDPCVMTYIAPADRWHILNQLLNQLSSIFAPHHVYFNERGRNTRVHYKSAWYVFSLYCTRTSGRGRYFITPFMPLPEKHDVSNLKIRIVLASEQTLREIGMGLIARPEKFFSDRHEGRWRILVRLSQLYMRQFQRNPQEMTFSSPHTHFHHPSSRLHAPPAPAPIPKHPHATSSHAASTEPSESSPALESDKTVSPSPAPISFASLPPRATSSGTPRVPNAMHSGSISLVRPSRSTPSLKDLVAGTGTPASRGPGPERVPLPPPQYRRPAAGGRGGGAGTLRLHLPRWMMRRFSYPSSRDMRVGGGLRWPSPERYEQLSIEDNCCSRLHVPVPTLKSTVDEEELAEIKASDEYVVYRCGD